MYLITNRNLSADEGGAEIFESITNREGPNNLRIVEITGRGRRIRARVLEDVLPRDRVTALMRTYNLQVDLDTVQYRSLELACLLFSRARREGKHILFYVHGYNNDVEDIIASARLLESTYRNLLVVPFSCPAKGGGALSGTANYIDDKRDARASSGALDRVFEHIRRLHLLLLEAQNAALWSRAMSHHGENLMATRSEFVYAQADECNVTINLLCHSMGNYVLKYATFPGGSHIRRLIFDNVCLVAADTQNQQHAAWVEKIEARGGVYVIINEKDHALQWARRKPGDEQRARLGHYLKALNASNATYIDVTSARGVGDDHSYFKGEPVANNPKLKRLFQKLFTGDRPERYTSQLTYAADVNAYRLK